MEATETPVKMYALTSVQGTAMNETALCATCLAVPREREAVLAAAAEAADWDGSKEFKDCTENDALECGCTPVED